MFISVDNTDRVSPTDARAYAAVGQALPEMSSYTSPSAHCMCSLKKAMTFSGCLPK